MTGVHSRFKHDKLTRLSNGFTLIEMMLVIVIIGLMATTIQFNIRSNEPDKILERSSARFAGIFEIAAEYSLLNNIEIGVVVDKSSYRFLGYDGTAWVEIPEQPILAEVTLPEGIVVEVQLEDLPIDEPLLFTAETFNGDDDEDFLSYNSDDDEVEDEEGEKKKKIVPHIYILSGGDITPFSMTFTYEENAYLEEEFAYRVSGVYTTPLTIEGPMLDD